MTLEAHAFDARRFLAYLQDKGVLAENEMKRISAAVGETSAGVEHIILEFGLLEEDELFRNLATFKKVPYVTAKDFDRTLVSNGPLKSEFMRRANVVPVAREEGGYLVASANPETHDVLSSIGFLLNAKVNGAVASPGTIAEILDDGLGDTKAPDSNSGRDIERLKALANDGPVVKLVNEIIGQAVAVGASDIHFEAQENGMRVRMRVDGLMSVDRKIPSSQQSTVTSRLKILANLNISERRRPQDGRADVVVRGRKIDIRLSTLPTQYGESIVLRILDRKRVNLDWEALSFPPERVVEIEKIMSSPSGIFLVAGPVGSGKTTTLYTALKGINSDDRKIITVEDPVEYALAGVNQVQVNPAIGMTFASALRAILRQDPNVVMVGEIRDEETAEIAVRAALVGRLVISTIHTNDAIGAVDRLLDLGVPAYLVGATLRGVLSQRLVRSNCSSCRGSGCGECGGNGLVGRMSLSEMLTVTENLSDLIGKGGRGSELGNAAEAEGFKPIKDVADGLISDGRLSRTEAIRALGQF